MKFFSHRLRRSMAFCIPKTSKNNFFFTVSRKNRKTSTTNFDIIIKRKIDILNS
jgi:hypothetical protein